MNRQTAHSNQEGFTLVEAIVAMFVLVVGVLSLYSMQIVSMQGNGTAMELTLASTWAGARIERLLSLPYTDTAFDNPGSAKDKAKADNGLNDTGALGTDDAAVGSETSPDGRYTIFWNVADEQLFAKLKTIRVIVLYQDRSVQKQVAMDYVKASM